MPPRSDTAVGAHFGSAGQGLGNGPSEGEVIGYNVLEYACNNKYESSLRAKFSTLTDEEIRNSFENLLKPSKGLAEAGRSRHMIDFIYGVNLSRALTQSFKVSNDGKRYRKRIALAESFHLYLSSLSQKERSALTGFGMVAGKQDLGTFAWEWFDIDGEDCHVGVADVLVIIS